MRIIVFDKFIHLLASKRTYFISNAYIDYKGCFLYLFKMVKNNIQQKVFFVIFFMVFTLVTAFATNKNEFESNHKNIPGMYDILDYQGGSISIEQILRDSSLRYYELNDEDKMALPGKEYWIRFRIKNNTMGESIMFVASRFYDMELYLPDTSGHYIRKKLSAFMRIQRRPMFSNEIMYVLPYSKKEETYYAKIKTHVNIGLGYYLQSIPYNFNLNITNFVFYAFVFGVLFVVLGYNIILFFQLKEKIYLFYGLYLVSLICYGLATWSFLYPLFTSIKEGFFIETIPYQCITIFLLLYSKEFNDTKLKHPLVDKLILASIALRIILFFVGFFTNNNDWFSPFYDVLLLTPAILAGILRYQQGYKPALTFLVAYFILIVGFLHHSVLRSIPFFNIIIFRDDIPFLFNTGLIEVFLLSYAISERFLILKKEKDAEQQKALEFQQQMLEKSKETQALKDKLNQELELLVAERTDELEKMNATLQQQAEEISRMNSLLQQDNEKLTKDVELLHKVRILEPNVPFEEYKLLMPDESTCLKFVAELKWKSGYQCKKCGYKKYYVDELTYARKCRLCGYKESATAHTLLDNVKFSLQKALYIIFSTYTTKNVNIKFLSESLELRRATCAAFHKKVEDTLLQSKPNRNSKEDWTALITVDK